MQTNTIARGDLFFLWHPDTDDTFSGYGLAVAPGRKDLLVGVFSVDKPQPVHDLWMAGVALTFGSYTLWVLSETEKRGIVCQMRIEEGSLQNIRRLDVTDGDELRNTLLPLLVYPPKPRFVLRWDPHGQRWQSGFARKLGTHPQDATESVEDAGPAASAGPASDPTTPLFPLGQVVATPGALAALDATKQTPFEFLARHCAGDWGDLVPEDVQENERALRVGARLFSAYHLKDGTKIYVITEWDRSVSTLLLPSEY